LGVLQHLLAGQRRTGGALAAGVADHPGEVSDEEDHLMAEVLELAQLINEDGMPEVQVRRGRVEARLDPQWLATLELFDQLGFHQEFIRTALDQRQLLFDRLHHSSRSVFPAIKREPTIQDRTLKTSFARRTGKWRQTL